MPIAASQPASLPPGEAGRAGKAGATGKPSAREKVGAGSTRGGRRLSGFRSHRRRLRWLPKWSARELAFQRALARCWPRSHLSGWLAGSRLADGRAKKQVFCARARAAFRQSCDRRRYFLLVVVVVSGPRALFLFLALSFARSLARLRLRPAERAPANGCGGRRRRAQAQRWPRPANSRQAARAARKGLLQLSMAAAAMATRMVATQARERRQQVPAALLESELESKHRSAGAAAKAAAERLASFSVAPAASRQPATGKAGQRRETRQLTLALACSLAALEARLKAGKVAGWLAGC